MATSINTHPAKVSRYKQLDSLRGIAAFFVFLSHCFLALPINDRVALNVKASPLGVLLNGNSAVMFFFVLSGFVLSLPFIDGRRPLSIAEFYLKRIFRIYPAYLLAILLAIFFKNYVHNLHGMQDFSSWVKGFWHWGFDAEHRNEILKTFLLIGPNFNADLIDPVIWSLVVEMKMSLLLPFIIVITSRCNLKINLLFFMLLLVIAYGHQTGYLYVFHIGVLLARYKDGLCQSIRQWPVYLVAIVMVLALALYNVNFEFYKPYGDTIHIFGYFWRNALAAVGSSLILLIALARKSFTTNLEKKVFIFFGEISYSFYLVHLPILITVCSFFVTPTVFNSLIIFLVVLSLSVILSYLSLRLAEKPFQGYAKQICVRFNLTKITRLNKRYSEIEKAQV
jgi:peptidoglycan/LPS O-acetylase OafA/YrhL